MAPARIRMFALTLALTVAALAITATPARADITAFIGLSPTPETHLAKGFAVGVSLLVIGFEFEYGSLSEDEVESLPGLRTYSGNILVQTPTSTQLYATIGAGGYQERMLEADEMHAAINLGGGIKFPLLGPIRVRADYRVFNLKGSPINSTYQRFYVGANLTF